jgi:acyl-CoA synthetase (AMP-forming)/AMP-acid ligase II
VDFAKLVVYQARAHLDEPAVAFPGGVATYRVLAAAMLTAADRIAGLGLPPGSIVGIDVRNPLHHIILMFALNLRGVASASVQTAFSVEASGLSPAAILVDTHATHHPPGLRLIPVDEGWFTVDPEAAPDFVRLLAMPGFPDENAVMRVIFSSGTTGVPKSAGITSKVLARRFGHSLFAIPGGAVRSLTLLGMSTLGGFLSPIWALGTGGVACFAGNPAEALHICRIFNVDVLTVAVLQLQAVLKALGNAPPPPLKRVIAGGSKISQDLLKDARARLCPNLTFSYGSSEAGIVAIADGSFLEGIEGAAGFVLPWIDLEVVDEDGKRLPPGTEGILRTRSEELAHYVVDHPDNALLFRDGWFYPGDIGTLRADGLLVVTGRSSEVINRGGAIVAPDLIERVLTSRPEILEAAAFGIPVSFGVEEIHAAVVARGAFDEQKLLQFCRERLADKAPSRITQVGEIPKSDSGKPLRRIVRDRLVNAAKGS